MNPNGCNGFARLWHRSRFIDVLFNSQVLRLNTRALARFQSFPNCYFLPERTSLTGRIIGNAVPPLMARLLVMNTIFDNPVEQVVSKNFSQI